MKPFVARLRPAHALLACGLLFLAGTPAHAQSACPAFGWQEGLSAYLSPTAPFPVNDTAGSSVSDCQFQQWSAEAFVWATALDAAGKPRFMNFRTPEDLLASVPTSESSGPLKLSAASRLEGAHAFVEADGNLLVAQNGYPVYASVHMNASYFRTAQQNLVKTGAYCAQNPDAFFRVGAAVFKATWLRIPDDTVIITPPPAGTFVTEALVPVLEQKRYDSTHYVVQPVPGSYVKARVALVGLHVVGYTQNHPEFLWATFEHRLNSPRTADNTFSPSGSSARDFTFYTAGTSFANANIANPQSATVSNPQLVFNQATQRFSPATQVVLENRTGGAKFPTQSQARADIGAVNSQLRAFLAGTAGAQATFQNYDLIGTLWLRPNSYLGLDPNSPVAQDQLQTLGVGSVNLANSTAETFQQVASNKDQSKVSNCFLCHNPGPPVQFQANGLPPLQPTHPTPEEKYCAGKPFPGRHISLSHVLEVGTETAVPNAIGIPHK